MTVEQLRVLKETNYQKAVESGPFTFLANIARRFGVKLSHMYGPKYLWKSDNISIYVDDYGHFMNVRWGDKFIASTHNERLFIPGKRFAKIKELEPELERVMVAQRNRREQKEKKKLLETV